jgi:outer membrane lipoprotein SlyB
MAMRWTVCGWGMAAMALVSCAAPAPREPATAAKGAAHGVILTLRQVPAGDMEYVVRTDDGATLAVVQPADPVLRAGVPIAIARGERATLAVR